MCIKINKDYFIINNEKFKDGDTIQISVYMDYDSFGGYTVYDSLLVSAKIIKEDDFQFNIKSLSDLYNFEDIPDYSYDIDEFNNNIKLIFNNFNYKRL